MSGTKGHVFVTGGLGFIVSYSSYIIKATSALILDKDCKERSAELLVSTYARAGRIGGLKLLCFPKYAIS